MNKPEALKRLTALENEASELRKIIESPQDVMATIESYAGKRDLYEVVCEIDGVHPIGSLPWQKPTNSDQNGDNAFSKVQRIIRVLNEGCVFDYGNSNQKKWRLWFEWDVKTSAFVFSDTAGDWSHSDTAGGARLSFESEKKALFFAKYFLKEMNDLLTIK